MTILTPGHLVRQVHRDPFANHQLANVQGIAVADARRAPEGSVAIYG